jgi:hypothetical protein
MTAQGEARPCPDCGATPPAARFYVYRTPEGAVRRSTYCVACHNARTTACKRADPERHNASARAWYARRRAGVQTLRAENARLQAEVEELRARLAGVAGAGGEAGP